MTLKTLTHLQRLEAESIHILREVVAEAENPVMLYSIGKDSAVMLHLAKKAFFPAPPPFPLLHVDTTWKFRDMYALRDKAAKQAGMDLLVYQNPEAKAQGINPFDHGSLHTDLWKTEGLKQALDLYGFDAAFGGARRDIILDQMIATNAGLLYRNECFNIAFEMLRTFTRDRDIEPATTFSVRVGFKNLGEIGGK